MIMPGAVELVDIWKSFRNKQGLTPVLAGISLTVKPQEFVSLLGPSGCGKSTLLNIISGLIRPDHGEVRIHGQDGRGRTGLASYMPQKDLLLPWRTVLDNVILPLEIEKVPRARARAEALALMETFGLAGFEQAYPAQLSGGMRQRAALLRTFLWHNDVILLDEPFGSLDAITKTRLHKWLLTVWEQFRPSVLFITHDIEEALVLSDRICVLSDRPARVRAEIPVDLARPRMPTHPHCIALKKELLGHLEL